MNFTKKIVGLGELGELVTLIKCLKGHKSLGLLFKSVL